MKKILYVFSFIPQPSLAAIIERQGAHLAGAESPMSLSYVTQILISFLVVIGFIFLMAWSLRKTGRFGRGDGQAMKIVSSVSLGMREKILIVEVGTVNIVIGVAPGQIRTLHVMEGGIEIKTKDDAKNYADRNGFKQLIEKFSKQ
jgi:flagellar protein FliO/FliZ